MSFVAKVLTAIGLVSLALLAWHLKQVFLLLFGGLIFAAIIGALASLLQRHARLPWRWSVAGAVLIIMTGLASLGWITGDALAQQITDLRERFPQALEAVRGWLKDKPLGPQLLEDWDSASPGDVSWSRIVGAAETTVSALAAFALMLLMGVFLAAEPALYRDGFLKLAPASHGPAIAAALDACADALAGWLKGQGVSMLFVGVATGVGLAFLGIPLALILGVIAGLLAFVPFFGPIASGVLAVLLAFTESPDKALYVAGMCLLIQQVEGNLLMPFVQRWAVALPPVLGLLSVFIFAGLFGLPGVLLATPLMVVLMVLVKKLYVENLPVLQHGSSETK